MLGCKKTIVPRATLAIPRVLGSSRPKQKRLVAPLPAVKFGTADLLTFTAALWDDPPVEAPEPDVRSPEVRTAAQPGAVARSAASVGLKHEAWLPAVPRRAEERADEPQFPFEPDYLAVTHWGEVCSSGEAPSPAQTFSLPWSCFPCSLSVADEVRCFARMPSRVQSLPGVLHCFHSQVVEPHCWFWPAQRREQEEPCTGLRLV